MKKLLIAIVLLAATPAYADPPSSLVDANAKVVATVFQPVFEGVCIALTWKYALHSYTGPATVSVDCATAVGK